MNGGGDLAGDGDQWHRIHRRVGDAGDEIGRAGAGGGDAHAGLAGGARIRIGRERGSLLMAHQDVAQLRARQRVIDRHDRAARITETPW